MSRVLLDASALVPVVVKTDHWRPDLNRVMAQLQRDRRLELWTTNWTLYEALAVAQRRGKPYATELFDFGARRLRIHRIGAETEQEALRRFLRWKDKTASVVDHANALVAVAEECDSIVSFDSDFIPLARAAGLTLLT